MSPSFLPSFVASPSFRIVLNPPSIILRFTRDLHKPQTKRHSPYLIFTMAKSIRSKAKRKNRTEFRKTIGTDAAKANMAIVQAKLQECIQTTQLNSFDRISTLFGGNDSNNINKKAINQGAAAGADDDDDEDEDVDMLMGDTAAIKKARYIAGKEASKIPTKKSTPRVVGMYGDKTSRKVAAERRGRKNGIQTIRSKSIEKRTGRSSSKKRSGKKLATI